MKTPISFFVAGIPKPAGSKRGFALKKGGVYTGRVVIADDNKKSKDWKIDVKLAAQDAYQGELWDGPIVLTLTFTLPRPQGHYRTGANKHLLRDGAPTRPVVKPDVLKLARGVEDALTSIIWTDDAHIVDEHLHKVYGSQPGCLVEIREAA